MCNNNGCKCNTGDFSNTTDYPYQVQKNYCLYYNNWYYWYYGYIHIEPYAPHWYPYPIVTTTTTYTDANGDLPELKVLKLKYAILQALLKSVIEEHPEVKTKYLQIETLLNLSQNTIDEILWSCCLLCQFLRKTKSKLVLDSKIFLTIEKEVEEDLND